MNGEMEPRVENRRPVEEQLREANQICRDIVEAAELMGLANELLEAANRRASDARMKSFFIHSHEGTKFRIEMPEGSEAIISNDGDVINESPTEFIATEVRSISERGLEFCNSITGDELHFDHDQDFEITPILRQD